MAWDDWNYAAPGSTGGPQQTIPGADPGFGPGSTFGLVPGPADVGIGRGGPLTTEAGQLPKTLWEKLTDALGAIPKMQMPGTTVGAPAGQTPQAPTAAPIFPAGPRPPGMGSYFQALQNPPANNLMARYAALQQLMRGR